MNNTIYWIGILLTSLQNHYMLDCLLTILKPAFEQYEVCDKMGLPVFCLNRKMTSIHYQNYQESLIM